MTLFHFLYNKSKGSLAVAALMGLVSGATSALLIAFIGQVLAGQLEPAPRLLLIFAPLVILALATRVASQFALIRLAHRAIYDLRMNLCRRILATPFEQLERIGKSRLIAMLTDDVQAIFDGVQIVPYLLVNIVTAAGCLVYMGYVSLTGGALVIICMLTGGSIYYLLHHSAIRNITVARAAYDRLVEHFHGVTDGAKELQLHVGRREDYLGTSLKHISGEFHREAIRGMNIYTISSAWAQFLLIAILGLFVFVFAYWGVLDRNDIAPFGLALLYMARPLDSALQMMPGVARARVALGKVDSLNLSLSEDVGGVRMPPAIPEWNELELANVVFGYPAESEDDRFLVGPVSLTFQPGEVVFLIGGNGSGKSTLAKLIVGLYAPHDGKVMLDGQPITDANRDWYRQHFSAIFSDFYLFDRLHGIEGAGDLGSVQDYLVRLHLQSKVRVAERMVQTAGLSQGQRKRLALLGAYLEDRPIYLFDEWAADQDPSFRDVFYTKLVPELRDRGKLLVIISHDERYFHLADRVIKMESGQVISNERNPNSHWTESSRAAVT